MLHQEAQFVWRFAGSRSLELDKPRIMAVLNATTDSFYAQSRCLDVNQALEWAYRAAGGGGGGGEGADMLDVGGESTRPGAHPVSEAEQIRRVVPVIRAIRELSGPICTIPISVDTTQCRVAREALDAGADVINDVSGGLDDPEMLGLIAERGAGVILMHRLVVPEQDRYSDAYAQAPEYGGDVTGAVGKWLKEAVERALCAGVKRESMVLDPGLGFGKGVEDNFRLIEQTGRLVELGYPILSALSRKSFVGRAMDESAPPEPRDRLSGTLGLSVMHYLAGASIFRVHDVAAHRGALDAVWRVCGGFCRQQGET